MNKGVKTILYTVKDVAKSTALFQQLLEVEPYANQPYYVGFKVGDQDIGLVPGGNNSGVTAFYHVDDIKNSLQILIDGGCQVIQDIKDVGQGRLVASAEDKDGNMIGLVQG